MRKSIDLAVAVIIITAFICSVSFTMFITPASYAQPQIQQTGDSTQVVIKIKVPEGVKTYVWPMNTALQIYMQLKTVLDGPSGQRLISDPGTETYRFDFQKYKLIITPPDSIK